MASTTNDERLTAVENAKKEAINNANKTYDDMINGSDAKYNELIQANKDWANKQQELQQQQSDFAIEKIEQQKDKAQKDYTKEQTGAYVDYQKAVDPFGGNEEVLAAQGLNNSGYAQSTRMNAFVSYQNRYATAREVYNNAVLSYDNAIKDAQLQNNAALAEIAFKSLQAQLEYALEGFQYKNTLLQNKLNTQITLDSEYHKRYQDVLQQINTENALAEQIRQFNEQMAEERRQFNASYSGGGSGGSGGYSSSYSVSDGGSNSKKTISEASQTSLTGSSNKSTSQTSGSPVGAQSSSSSVKSGGSTWYTLSPSNFKKLGVSGAPSQKTIDGLVSSGALKAKVINGKMYYQKGSTKKTTKTRGFTRTIGF